jgi:hypothetical protein
MGHGKGPHVGARAYLKQAIRKEQLKPHGENLQNAHNVILYLQRSMSQPRVAYEGAQKDAKRVFWEMKERNFERI